MQHGCKMVAKNLTEKIGPLCESNDVTEKGESHSCNILHWTFSNEKERNRSNGDYWIANTSRVFEWFVPQRPKNLFHSCQK